ncbi:hypothetical protein SE15_01000 [Thermanaerothrix daxensis]|uniref:Major facilitator superfamily (MFS) profile domain-containing protein n=1 Tax=Thermanaerothrix daxensis TaxID=869279 RepID=A0A0P6YMA6_9CHLR|nr:MFS transporter [Thermanaerothrix daxensis]KPL83852.1 hypothetical protein SE15_01000 [Thermanaerothrix daxensis]
MKRLNISALRALSPTLALFMFAMILANIASRMESPMLSLYLRNLGASVEQVGLFFTVGMFAPLLLQVFGGWISDSLGYLRTIAIGSLIGLVGSLWLPFVPSWEWALVAIIAASISGALISPTFRAFIAEHTSEDNRGKVYGMFDSVFGVVNILGPSLGGFLADRLGFRGMLIVAAGLYATATFIRVSMSRLARAAAQEPKGHLNLRQLKANLVQMIGLATAGTLITWILVFDGLQDFSFRLSDQFYPIYLKDLYGYSPTNVGSLYTIMGLTAALFNTLGGWLSDRYGERWGLVGGLGIFAVATLLFLGGGAFPLQALVWGLFGLGQALYSPAFNALISKVAPRHLRGLAFGLLSTTLGLFSLPAPYLGGLMWEVLSPQWPFVINALMLLITLPIIWLTVRPQRIQQEQARAVTLLKEQA